MCCLLDSTCGGGRDGMRRVLLLWSGFVMSPCAEYMVSDKGPQEESTIRDLDGMLP